MSSTHYKASSRQNAGSVAGKSGGRVGRDDPNIFNLRDTLSGISVRETNFSEFLAVLKQRGALAVKV